MAHFSGQVATVRSRRVVRKIPRHSDRRGTPIAARVLADAGVLATQMCPAQPSPNNSAGSCCGIGPPSWTCVEHSSSRTKAPSRRLRSCPQGCAKARRRPGTGPEGGWLRRARQRHSAQAQAWRPRTFPASRARTAFSLRSLASCAATSAATLALALRVASSDEALKLTCAVPATLARAFVFGSR